jgi:hypothetical protein
MRSPRHLVDCGLQRRYVVAPITDKQYATLIRESPHHGDYFWIGIKVKQLARELGGRPCIASFREDLNGAAQRDLQMWGLELAMGEVRCKFKTPSDVVWRFLRNAAALKLNRYTEQILTSGGHSATPLRQVNMPKEWYAGEEDAYLLGFLVR